MSASSRSAAGSSRSTRETAWARARYWPRSTAWARSGEAVIASNDRSGFCEQIPGDHHALNLAGAFADRAELHVGVVLLRGKFFDEAVAAEDLHAFLRAAHGHLARLELSQRGELRHFLTRVFYGRR